MLTFKQFVAEETQAKAFVAKLLEQAASEDFVLTQEQKDQMKAILELFPNILKRERPQHVTYLGTKAMPSLDDYDLGRRRKKD